MSKIKPIPTSWQAQSKKKCVTTELAISSAAREEFREKITYTEARRLQGPIYEVALAELYEEGCTIAAQHFERLVIKETSLYEDKRIRTRVRHKRALLLACLENVKLAERAARLVNGDGMEVSLRLLLQTVNMIERHGANFNWLVGELYEIIIRTMKKISDKDVPRFQEIKARIHSGYGHFLSKSNETLEEAVTQLNQAFDIAKEHSWPMHGTEGGEFLAQAVAVCLCETLLTIAKKIKSKQLKKSAELAHRAVQILAELGIRQNRALYCRANLQRCEYVVASGDAEIALTMLEKVQQHIMATDSAAMKSELFLQQGLCHYHLKNRDLCLRKFRQSLRLSEKYNLLSLKAHALVQLGKIYSAADASQYLLAKQSFEEARRIFALINDADNLEIVQYLCAKIVADEIFPQLVDLMNSSVQKSCDMYELRRWKNECMPFWNDELEWKQRNDAIACLLERE